MNRGSAAAEDKNRKRAEASMRPRFMNRGSDWAQTKRGGKQYASMRPRFMNRGSCLRSTRAPEGRGSFNEAPIHESGKFRNVPKLKQARIASMRPRFMNRGSPRSP